MAIKDNNNSRFDVDSKGIRTRWIKADHTYDSNFRIPSDSAAVTESVRLYISKIMGDMVAAGYSLQAGQIFNGPQPSSATAVDDSDFNGGLTDIGNAPVLISAFSPSAVDSEDYTQLRDKLNDKTNLFEYNTNTTIEDSHYYVQIFDSDGQSMTVHSDTLLRLSLGDVLANDFFARKHTTDAVRSVLSKDNSAEVTIASNFNVEGVSTLGNIVVDKNEVSTDGSIDDTGEINIKVDTKFDENVDIDKDLVARGSTTFGVNTPATTHTIIGKTTLAPDASIGNSATLNVQGNTDIDSNLNVDGTLNVEGETTLHSDLTVDSDTTTTVGDLTVLGQTAFGGDVTFGSDVTIDGTLQVNDNVTIGVTSTPANLNVSGNTTIEQDLTVRGDTSTHGEFETWDKVITLNSNEQANQGGTDVGVSGADQNTPGAAGIEIYRGPNVPSAYMYFDEGTDTYFFMNEDGITYLDQVPHDSDAVLNNLLIPTPHLLHLYARDLHAQEGVFSQSITVGGDVNVIGTVNNIDQAEISLSVQDKFIVLNSGETGPGIGAGGTTRDFSGIEFERGVTRNVGIMFSETNSGFNFIYADSDANFVDNGDSDAKIRYSPGQQIWPDNQYEEIKVSTVHAIGGIEYGPTATKTKLTNIKPLSIKNKDGDDILQGYLWSTSEDSATL